MLIVDDIVSDIDAVLAAEGIEINENVDTLGGYIDALKMIISDENLEESNKSAVEMAIGLLERSALSRANKEVNKLIAHQGRIHKFNQTVADQTAKAAAPNERGARLSPDEASRRGVEAARSIHKAANKKRQDVASDTKFLRKVGGAAKADKLVDKALSSLDGYRRRIGHQRGVAIDQNVVAQELDRENKIRRMRKLKRANKAYATKTPAEPVAAAPKKQTVIRFSNSGKVAQNSSVEMPDSVALISEMVDVLQSAGYEVPEDVGVQAFLEDVAILVNSDEEMDADAREMLGLALEELAS